MTMDALTQCYPAGVPADFPVDLFAPIPALDDAGVMVVRDLVLQARIDEFQAFMLTLPQVETPVVNLFGGGVYARQVFIPKGTVAIGAIHLDEHINFVLQGDVTMLTVDGPKRIKAPAMFVAPPGSKKFGYANEDTIWATAQPALSDDPEEIVALTTVKSFKDYRRIADRSSYQNTLIEFGFNEATARRMSDDESTYLDRPDLCWACSVERSEIEGNGLHAKRGFIPGDRIAPAMVGGKRTRAGRYANHSATPNARMELVDSLRVDLVATKPIKAGDEITTDYGATLRLFMSPVSAGVLQ